MERAPRYVLDRNWFSQRSFILEKALRAGLVRQAGKVKLVFFKKLNLACIGFLNPFLLLENGGSKIAKKNHEGGLERAWTNRAVLNVKNGDFTSG